MMTTIGTMTYFDPLTGLPEPPVFSGLARKSLLENGTLILVPISIRDLSEIKTLLGPRVTDGILASVAETLRTVSDDDLVMGRIGDAEFGMIIPSNSSGFFEPSIDSITSW